MRKKTLLEFIVPLKMTLGCLLDTLSQKEIKIVWLDLPSLNPCWLCLTIALSLKCLSIGWFSPSLSGKWMSIDYEFCSSLRLPSTLPINWKNTGELPVSRDLPAFPGCWSMYGSTPAMTPANSFRTLGWTPSGPMGWRTFSWYKCFHTVSVSAIGKSLLMQPWSSSSRDQEAQVSSPVELWSKDGHWS